MDDNDPDTATSASPQYDVINLVPQEQEPDPSKTGPKPKKLVAVEVLGYEVGRGLRRKVIKPDDVYKLAAIGMNDREIARWFDIDHQVLTYNFHTILEKGREDLKQSLRVAQIKLALSGNAAMLIWLGKNILNQQDQPVNNEENAPLPWSDD